MQGTKEKTNEENDQTLQTKKELRKGERERKQKKKPLPLTTRENKIIFFILFLI